MTIFYLYLKLVYNLILSCLSTDSAATDNRIPKFNLSFEYLKYLCFYICLEPYSKENFLLNAVPVHHVSKYLWQETSIVNYRKVILIQF